jgi:ABC-2 type transport system permease protein
VANALLSERVWHTLERLQATPLRGFGLIAGKCATPFLVLILQQLLVLVVGTWAFGLEPHHPLLLAAVGLPLAFTVLALGAALASVTRTPSSVSAATDLMSLLSTALSGALLPLAALPFWARAITPISPGYWAVHGFDAAMHGDTRTSLLSGAALLGVTVLVGWFAARRLMRPAS